jgi:hypothetical protein
LINGWLILTEEYSEECWEIKVNENWRKECNKELISMFEDEDIL